MNNNESVIDNESIGLRIKDIRTHQKISQQTLADKLGIRQSDISDIETGKRKLVDVTLLSGLSEVLQVPLSYIITGEYVEGIKKSNEYYWALISVQRSGRNLKNLASEWQDDARVVCTAIQDDGDAIQYASPRLMSNRQIIEMALRRKPTALEFVPDSFKDDKELVKKAITMDARAFPFASARLQNDVELFEIVLRSDRAFLSFFDLDSSIRENKLIGELLIKSNPEWIEFMSGDLRRDVDLISIGAAKLGLSTLDREDPHTMMSLLKEKGEYVLLYCSDYLYENKEFVLESIKSTNGEIWRNVSLKLKSDRNFCARAVKLAPSILEIDENLIQDQELFEIGAKVVGLGGDARNNPDCFLRSIEQYGYLALIFMGEEISNNESLMVRACIINSLSIVYVNSVILHRKSFWRNLIAEAGTISSRDYMDYYPSELSDDESFMLELIKSDAHMISYASDRLNKDNGFWRNALKTNYQVKRFGWLFIPGETDEDKELFNYLNFNSDEEK